MQRKHQTPSSDDMSKTNSEAIMWVFSGTALFSLVFASAKLAGDGDLVWQIIFIRYLVGFLLLVCVAGATGTTVSVSPRWSLHFCRAGFGGAGGCAAIYAAANIPVADAAAIGLLDAAIAVVLGLCIFRELVSPQRWLAIAVCLIGAMIVVFGHGAFQAHGNG